MLSINPRALRPGFSETFPYPTRTTSGAQPLAYFDTGPASPDPPLLLVHGLGGNFTHWEHVAPELALTRRVIGLDLPGCGDSVKHGARDPRYSIRMYADAAVRLLDELAVDRAVLVGHSLGGAVVSEAALAHPARVARLALIDSAGFQRYPTALRVVARVFLHPRLLAPVMKRVAPRLLGNVFHQRNALTEKFVGQAEGRPVHPTLDEFAAMACAISPDLVGRHFLDDVERIVQPALVIWGDRDRLLPFDEVPRWAARLPAGRLVVLHDCGHMPIIERPHAVVDALRDFLDAAAGAAFSRHTGSA